jgi:tetratricopeptide (TPR) repeat protein
VPPEPIAELLDVAEAGASPATLVPEPMQLDAASRDWLWARVATRLVVARARTLDRLGAPRGALALLETAPPTDPPSAEVAYLRGRLLDGLGEPLAARALYREALALAPHARAEAHLAALLAQAGEAGAPREGSPVSRRSASPGATRTATATPTCCSTAGCSSTMAAAVSPSRRCPRARLRPAVSGPMSMATASTTCC